MLLSSNEDLFIYCDFHNVSVVKITVKKFAIAGDYSKNCSSKHKFLHKPNCAFIAQYFGTWYWRQGSGKCEYRNNEFYIFEGICTLDNKKVLCESDVFDEFCV